MGVQYDVTARTLGRWVGGEADWLVLIFFIAGVDLEDRLWVPVAPPAVASGTFQPVRALPNHCRLPCRRLELALQAPAEARQHSW